MQTINFPNPPKYYIAYTGSTFSYGFVQSNQCLETGLDNIETFDLKSEYLIRAAELGIIIEEM